MGVSIKFDTVKYIEGSPVIIFKIYCILSFSLYTLWHPNEHYWQVYFVHSGLQDESLQVTISKLP